MNKKQLLQFISFVTLALLMVFGVGQLFRDKDTTMASFYSEPKNTIEVITVGSSHVNSGVIPAVFWQEQGINAHNVYSWSQPIWISYHYIKEALRFQKPKVVVVDLYGMMYGNSGEQPKEIDEVNYRNSFSIDPSLNFLQMTQTVADCGIDLKNPIDFLNPIRYHTGWKNLSVQNFTTNTHKQYSYLKGYGIQDGMALVTRNDTTVKVEPRTPYITAVNYLDKIVKLSEKENFELVFVMLPYEFKPEERELFAWLENYSKEKEIPYFNYCEETGEKIGFDYNTDFADVGHTNYNGAQKITSHIAEFVKKEYNLDEGKSLHNKAQLDKDATQVYRVLKVNRERSTDPKIYLERLKNDENSVLIASVIGTQDTPQELKEAMDIVGLKCDTSYIGVVDSGKKEEYSKEHIYSESLVATNDGAMSDIIFKGKSHMPKETKIKFAIYDKVLQRPTFYFYYDTEAQGLIIKDYPAK